MKKDITYSLAILVCVFTLTLPGIIHAKGKSSSSTSAAVHVLTVIKNAYGVINTLLPLGTKGGSPDAKNIPPCTDANASGLRYCNFIFPDSVVGMTTYTYSANVPKADEDGTTNLLIDVFAPMNDTDNLRPLVIFAHGGGGERTNGSIQEWCKERFAVRGYVCGSIDYRGATEVAGKFTNKMQDLALSDMQAAARWARDNSIMLGIDPNKIIFMGSSAGAITAIQASIMGNNLDATIFDDPKSNTTHKDEPSWSCMAVTLAGAVNGTIDNYLDHNDSPAAMYHGEEDTKVPYEEALATKNKMSNLGIPTTLLSFPNTGHDLGHTEEIEADLLPKIYTATVIEGCPPAYSNITHIPTDGTTVVDQTTGTTSGGGGGGTVSGGSPLLPIENKSTDTSTAQANLVCPYLKEPIYIEKANNPDEVKKLEKFLNEHEGEKLSIDGIFDVNDIAAVKRFQISYTDRIPSLPGINLSLGNVGSLTQNEINIISCMPILDACPAFTEYNSISRNSTSAEVFKTKRMLTALGYYDGPVNAMFDETLKNSLSEFQQTFHSYVLDPGGFTPGIKSSLTNKFLNKFLGCNTPAVKVGLFKWFNY
jgi:acetyl esterase/lipase